MPERTRLPHWMLAAPVVGLLFAPTAPALAEAIVEAEPPAVTDCRKLGAVQGHSGYGKHHARGSAPRLAKARALQWAKERGATHLVWSSNRARGIYQWLATGLAYDCG
jgi:hypothetical protein